MKSFTFIANRFTPAFKMAKQILPALEKAVVFYHDEQERKVVQISWSPEEVSYEAISSTTKVAIQKIRGDKNLTAWTNIKDLTFENEARKEQQYSIGDEVDNSVLCLKFLNPFDGSYDLLYLYLDNALSQFQMTSNSEVLSTANKSILEKTLHQSIKFILDQDFENREVLGNIINAKNQEKEDRNALNHELEKLKKNYAKSILNFSNHHLDIISKKENVQFKLADSALAKLKTFVGDFESLEGILQKAASAAYNLSYEHREIIIDAGHIILYQYKPKNQTSSVIERSESKYSKTVVYLDRYEEAAQRLLLKDLSVNGKNVAQYCQPSVSAAAITINIRAHKANILTLLDRHPDKWMVLREHFKPIQNVMKNQHLGKAG